MRSGRRSGRQPHAGGTKGERRAAQRRGHGRERRDETRNRGFIFLALTIFSLALIVRLLPIEEYHGWDESTYLQHAEHIAFGKSNYNELAFRPPLLPLLFAGGFMLWHSPYTASIIVAVFSASITLAMFFIGRKLHSPQAGLLAALIVAVHPAFVRFGHLLLTDALVASMLAFALLFALYDKWWALLLSGVFLGLAGLAKFSGLGALIPLTAYIAYRAWRDADRTKKSRKEKSRSGVWSVLRNAGIFLAGFVMVLSPYIVWSQSRYGSFVVVLERAQAIVNLQHGGPLYYLSLVVFTVPLLLGLAFFAWALLGKWDKRRQERRDAQDRRSRRNQQDGRELLALAALSLVWALLILGYLTTLPNKEYRFALAGIVPLLALAGIGYAMMLERIAGSSAQDSSVRHAATVGRGHTIPAVAVIAVVVLLLAFSLGSFSRLVEPQINHYKQPPVDMALRIKALNDTSKPIYATSDYPIYGYYTDNQVVVVDGPMFVEAYPRIMPRDGYLVVGRDSVREPTFAWADRQKELARLLENDQIIVYAYDNPRHSPQQLAK